MTVPSLIAAEYSKLAWVSWQTVFDRYTGYNFETTYSYTESSSELQANTAEYQLDVDGTVYDVTLDFSYIEPDDTHETTTITVHHPTAYDGVVFHMDTSASIYNEISYDEPFKMLDYDGFVTEDALFVTAMDK